MSEQKRSGGIQFGNVGRDVKFEAGGDIVGGDKTTTTTVSGFRGDEDKQRFQAEIDVLREILREIKGHVEASSDVSADDKDELTGQIIHHVKELKKVKEETAPLNPGQA